MKQLNDTKVPDDLYHRVTDLKRAGSKVFLVFGELPPDIPAWVAECGNCIGSGVVGIQYFTGGPYRESPPIQNLLKNPKQPNDVPARLTAHDGKWFKQKTKTYHCPVCQGTGVGQRKQASTRAVAF